MLTYVFAGANICQRFLTAQFLRLCTVFPTARKYCIQFCPLQPVENFYNPHPFDTKEFIDYILIQYKSFPQLFFGIRLFIWHPVHLHGSGESAAISFVFSPRNSFEYMIESFQSFYHTSIYFWIKSPVYKRKKRKGEK